MKKSEYPSPVVFNPLFGQAHVRANCNNNMICRGKYPPLNGDMPVIEPLKIRNMEKNGSSKIESVVSIMERLATVAENRNVRVRKYQRK